MGKVGIQIDSDLYVRLHEIMRREAKTIDEILDRYIPARPVPMNTKKVEFLYRGENYNITRMAKLVGCAPSYFTLAKKDPAKIEKVLARFADPGVLPPSDRPSLARVIYEAYRARG